MSKNCTYCIHSDEFFEDSLVTFCNLKNEIVDIEMTCEYYSNPSRAVLIEEKSPFMDKFMKIMGW